MIISFLTEKLPYSQICRTKVDPSLKKRRLCETRFFNFFKETLLDLPTENGIYVLTQLLGRVNHRCTALSDVITDILKVLIHKHPDQVIWHLLDLYGNYDDLEPKDKNDPENKDRYQNIYFQMRNYTCSRISIY